MLPSFFLYSISTPSTSFFWKFWLIEIMKTSEVFERTWKIFSNQENTGFSFVDASNLACMEIRKIRKIATFDKDFLRVRSAEVVNGLST